MKRDFFRDANPVITVLSPQSGDSAAPTLRIHVTCSDDDPIGCKKIVIFADGSCGRFCGSTFSIEVTGGVMDTTVTFPTYSVVRSWRLSVRGYDSHDQLAVESVTIYTPATTPPPATGLRRLKPR
jgi:hypothetical protein